MTTIVTRQGKGSPLSTVEMDNNLTTLNNNKVEKVNPTTSGTLTHTGSVAVSDKTVSTLLYTDKYETTAVNEGTLLNIGPNGTGSYAGVVLSSYIGTDSPATWLVQYPTQFTLSTSKRGAGAYTPIVIYTSDIERFRISTSGAWGLSGTNYGSSGQFLMSNGSSSPPTWNTVDLTTKVSKSGDIMAGNLTISNGSPSLMLGDTTYGDVMAVNYDGGIAGFYKFVGTGTGWKMYVTDGGNIWTPAFGLLTDYFSAKVHTHNYAGINSNFDWELVHNATIGSNATLNVLSNYGYGIYYYTTVSTSGILITCGNGATLVMSTEAISVSVNASDILSNSGSGSRTLSLYKLRKTA